MIIETKNIDVLIRTHRKDAKLTQEELADLTGVSSITIHRIEQGIHSPRVSLIEKLINTCLEKIDINKRFKRKIILSSNQKKVCEK